MLWSFNQSDIAGYYKLYLKLITFWKSKFPDSIFDANYEKIVSNPEEETKKEAYPHLTRPRQEAAQEDYTEEEACDRATSGGT